MERFSILSLNSDGARGVLTLALLKALEEILEINVADHFDLITGTSAGGVIALGLGFGLTPTEIFDFYIKNESKIFIENEENPASDLFPKAKYKNAGLMTALNELFGNKTLGDSNKRLIIPAYSLSEHNIYLFRTPHHKRLIRDYKIPAFHIATAATATPKLFPPFNGMDGDQYLDGSIWANNPSMVALTESYGTLNIPLESSWVCNLASTTEKIDKNKDFLGLDAQDRCIDSQIKFFIGKEKYQRIKVAYNKPLFELSASTSVKNIMDEAQDLVHKASREFKKKFASHKSSPFEPIQGDW